ncbi:hypothetical protein SEUCBS139899_007711 [Sporothrix eucalyptigena]
MCYDDSDAVYKKFFESGKILLQKILERFDLGLNENQAPAPSGEAYALNTLPWQRSEIVESPELGSVGIARGNGALLVVEPLPTGKSVTVKETLAGVFCLENKHLSVTVEKGTISSLIDKRMGREVLAGRANQFTIFDDKPLYWQAWDVEIYHLETRKELTDHVSRTEILEDLPHRVSVVTTVPVSSLSSIRSVISLSAIVSDEQAPIVECYADIEWHETMRFLKVEFPVRIHSHEATYETQYGVVKRPTHYNTSWDMAKFEVCSHKFADLSEHNYGVSILNDSKYGFSTAGNVMRLSLLRAPKAPDDTADMGTHHIRWAILPHSGPLAVQTVRAAFNFNNPLHLVSKLRTEPVDASTLLQKLPLFIQGDDNLILDTIKRGEDDFDVSQGELPTRPERSIIVRIYEALGGWGRGSVNFTFPVKEVFRTNLLEDNEKHIPLKDTSFNVELDPFQVSSYRLVLA